MIVAGIILFIIPSALAARPPSRNHVEAGFRFIIVSLDDQILKNLVGLPFNIEISYIIEKEGVVGKCGDLDKRNDVQDDRVVQVHEARVIKEFSLFLEQVHWTNDQITSETNFLLQSLYYFYISALTHIWIEV